MFAFVYVYLKLMVSPVSSYQKKQKQNITKKQTAVTDNTVCLW